MHKTVSTLGTAAMHPREMTDMCNNKLLNKFCWLFISTVRKWEKAPETLIPLQGTIYRTSMYSSRCPRLRL
jgi:hypothetical protein